MKYIIEIDGIESTRYTFNLWSTVEFEDGTVAKDAREEHEDDLGLFILKVKNRFQQADIDNQQNAIIRKKQQLRCSNGELEPCNCAMH